MQRRTSLVLRRRDTAAGWGAITPVALALFLLGAAAPTRAGTLDRVREQGKLTLGYRSDARPFSYEDESGKAAGYSVVLCQKVADAVKAESGLGQIAVEYVKVASSDRFDALGEGTIDLLCGAATATLERRTKVAFSIPIFPSGIGALLRKDAPERLKDVLEGREPPYRPLWRASLAQVLEKRVLSARAGTTAESWLVQKRDEFNVNAEIVTVKTYPDGVDRVLGRRSDVLFGDRAILLDAAARGSAAGDLIVLARQFTYEPIALASVRGDEDFRLLVDRVLSRLYRSGEIGVIYTKFFGEPDASALEFFRFVALPE
jgi:ABC-type amino acid transport substrate-binding protein